MCKKNVDDLPQPPPKGDKKTPSDIGTGFKVSSPFGGSVRRTKGAFYSTTNFNVALSPCSVWMLTK